jgi:hypothetical protein
MTALKPYVPSKINRARDPSVESGTTGAQASTDATMWPATVDTTVKFAGASSWKLVRTTKTLTDNTLANFTACPSNNTRVITIPVTPGTVVSVGIMERCAVVNHRWRVTLTFRDAANVALADIAGSMGTNPNPDGGWWQAKINNRTVPPLAVTMGVQVALYMPSSGGLPVGGETSWIDGLMVSFGQTTVEPYFDGATPGCSWSGTPNQSESVRAVVTPWTLTGAGNAEQPLDVAGLWDGASLQPVDLADVVVL